MNRREALKKLAAGGAIAAGGSLVLSSNAVAQTASGMPIVNIPPPGMPIDSVQPSHSGSSGVLTLVDNSQPASASGSGSVTTTHQWRILDYSISQPNTVGITLTSGPLQIRASGYPTCGSGSCPTVYQTGINSAEIVPRFKNGGNKKYRPGDLYTIGLYVIWQVAGDRIEAEYVIDGVIGGSSTKNMVPGSYYVNGVAR